MKKFDLIKALAMAFVIVSGVSAQTVWDGTADQSWYDAEHNKFIITTAEQLAGLAKLVNDGNDMEGKTITLGADIVLNDTEGWQNWATSAPAKNWTPIGYRYPQNGIYYEFLGTFDGAGFVISGVYINSSSDGQGLFGVVSYGGGGIIKNLGVVASYVRGGNDVGGLVGYSYEGSITNCYFMGNVEGGEYVGGLVGYIRYGSITNCYATGNVEGGENVGGLVGVNRSVIGNCYSIGNVTVTGGNYIHVGGLVGWQLEGNIEDCYYDKETSNCDDLGKGRGMTTAQMKQQSTYNYWDFTNIWAIDPKINDGYPYLRSFGEIQGSNTPIAKSSGKTANIGFAGINNGQINLNLKAGVYTAQLYNLQGRLVRSVDINAINGINATGLRTDNLSKGIFILNVKQAGTSVLKHKIAVK